MKENTPTPKKKVNHPHNNFFETGFKIAQVMEDFVEECVPELQGELESGSFKVIADTWFDSFLGEHRADMLYLGKLKDMEVFINILLEHKIKGQNPLTQVLRYLSLKFSKEELYIEVENRARKKKKEPLLDKKLRLTIPIVIYHGKTKFDKRPLADLFNVPREKWRKYIPEVNIILVNLEDFPDKKLFNLRNKILSAFLLLLKHTGENEFILQHSKKIFKFVEEKSAGEQTIELLKSVIMYIYQTFNLKEEDIRRMVNEIPDEVDDGFVSTYDRVMARGEAKGKAEGIQIGASISKQETEIRKNIEFVVKLLLEFPDWTNEKIAELVGIDLRLVENTKKEIQNNKEDDIKKFAKKLFKDIPNIGENNLVEAEKWMIEVWKDFKKKKSPTA